MSSNPLHDGLSTIIFSLLILPCQDPHKKQHFMSLNVILPELDWIFDPAGCYSNADIQQLA
jgi:hypothetical protein